MTQAEALTILKCGYNVYLTGAAGSGKTYVLNQYVSYLKDQGLNVAVTASTGIAATHIGGMTIHSWSGIGIKDYMHPTELEALEEKEYLWKRINRTDVLIIDEISMLSAATLDLVELVCRTIKRSEKPFGGIQIILSGDLFQLPPISKYGTESLLVPRSAAWRKMEIKICYLEEQHRQEDKEFMVILNEIRTAKVSSKTIKTLEASFKTKLPKKHRITKLFTHNIDVDSLNQTELSKIDARSYSATMTTRGKGALTESLKKSCLAPEVLTLKEGAAVMFVKNNYERGFVNGTLGRVVSFTGTNYPVVETFGGKRITAEPESWQVEENGKVVAEIAQVPLRLAWAITVHKSQGMTIDAAEIDLSKTFVAGQGYVALSRVRSLKGLKLTAFNRQALEVDPAVLAFDENLRDSSGAMNRYLESLSKKEIEEIQTRFISK